MFTLGLFTRTPCCMHDCDFLFFIIDFFLGGLGGGGGLVWSSC